MYIWLILTEADSIESVRPAVMEAARCIVDCLCIGPPRAHVGLDFFVAGALTPELRWQGKRERLS